MILFRLRCGSGHEFEAWFRDGAAFDAQAAAGEIACPECDATDIAKAPMAPNVARKRSSPAPAEADAAPAEPAAAKPEPSPAELRRLLQKLRRQVEANCDNVGDKFASEARKIHNGESDPRNIYGDATDAEHRELIEEGVAVHRIPWLPPNDA